MKIAIMRHGPAEDYCVSGRDHDRALTRSGRQRVRDVARALASFGEAPRELVSSPLVRARETAEEVADTLHRALGLPGEVPTAIRPELSPGRDGLELVGELFAAGRDNVVLIGHEPDLSDLVAALTGFAPPGGMRKAMVVSIDLAPDPREPRGYRSSSRFVLDPKTLLLTR